MLRSQNSPIGYGRGWCQNACRGHKQKNMLISFLSIDPWRTVMFKGGVYSPTTPIVGLVGAVECTVGTQKQIQEGF